MDIFGQKSCFRPKKVFRPKFWFGRNFSYFGGTCFGFGVSAKILFRLSTRYERVLSKHFPEDEKRPSIEELEAGATAMLSMGHPLLLTGLRPAPPNFVYIGKAPNVVSWLAQSRY